MATRSSALKLLAWLAMAAPAHGQSSNPDSGLTIEINVPAFRLDARVDGVTIRSFPIAAGMRAYPTPIGEYDIRELHWNPWWHPPDSWWARNEKETPPGPTNPMGRAKMALGDTRLFIHGTPLTQSIGKAASHACLRMLNADAIVLAKLVQRHGEGTLSDAETDSILARGKPTVRVVLKSPVPVRIVYRLVELRGQELTFYPDVYRRGREDVIAEALTLLNSAGLDTSALDRALLGRIAREGAAKRAAVDIGRLLLPSAIGTSKP